MSLRPIRLTHSFHSPLAACSALILAALMRPPQTMIDNVRADPILIKRYAGRRLYNTATLTYATLDDLANMVLEHRRFVVRDVDTGGDITREILDQILGRLS
jgi:PHB/PHA accumulation regulator DNA-binding domain